LHSKLQSAGAQKGIVFSSSGFQSGAIKFADAHGIATIQLTEGKSNYFTKSADGNMEPPPWVKIEPIIGWLIQGNHYSIVSRNHPEYLREFLANEN
jgi:restriction system protein